MTTDYTLRYSAGLAPTVGDAMEPGFFGTEQVTDEDRAYKGSRFSEVRDAIFANPYQKVWGGAGEPPLPVYDVNLMGVLRGILPFGGPHFFRQAVEGCR